MGSLRPSVAAVPHRGVEQAGGVERLVDQARVGGRAVVPTLYRHLTDWPGCLDLAVTTGAASRRRQSRPRGVCLPGGGAWGGKSDAASYDWTAGTVGEPAEQFSRTDRPVPDLDLPHDRHQRPTPAFDAELVIAFIPALLKSHQ